MTGKAYVNAVFEIRFEAEEVKYQSFKQLKLFLPRSAAVFTAYSQVNKRSMRDKLVVE